MPPRALSEGELVAELAARVAKRVEERLMGGDPWAADPCDLHLPGYRERFYRVRGMLLPGQGGGCCYCCY